MDDDEIVQVFEDAGDDSDIEITEMHKRKIENLDSDVESSPRRNLVSSPIRLTAIRDLPASENVDTVTLKDLLYHENLSHMVGSSPCALNC